MPDTPQPDIDVRYIANLARLELTDAEAVQFQAEISAILGYVRQLQEVDVEGVEPTAHATLITNVVRPDGERPSEAAARYLANFPALTEETLLRVPQVITGGAGDEGGA